METRKVIVREIVSQGTFRADDGNLYVLRGVPDTDEEYGNQAAARKLVEDAILGKELLINADTVKELPDLPGMEIEAFDANGSPLTPYLASRVAGALANHPIQ